MIHGNFNISVLVVLGSHVHTGLFSGVCERVNVEPRKQGKTYLFCKACFWAFLACFGLVSDEYMNIYEGYKTVTGVFAL
jgi:hypothetical protein